MTRRILQHPTQNLYNISNIAKAAQTSGFFVQGNAVGVGQGRNVCVR